MEEQFVPYELALKLKALGFNEEVLGFYWTDTRQLVFSDPNDVKRHNGVHLQAPLWQQAFDWMREKHNMNVSISTNDKYFFVSIKKVYYFIEEGATTRVTKPFKNYPEAKHAALEQLISIIEN